MRIPVRLFAAGLVALVLATVSLATVSIAAKAQQYPDRPVKIIVPAAAGGGIDFTARLIAAELQKALGQPFLVENKGGASGNIGTLQAARSTPDGYTLFLGMSGFHVTNPALFSDLKWDPVRDFSGVAMIMRAPHVVVVNKDFPAKSLSELVAYAKAHPGALNYASPGVGTQNQIAAELLGQLTSIKLTPIYYRGTGPALNDVLAGTVNLFINTTQSLIGPLQGDRIRALAVLSRTRHPLLPNLPTNAEAGVPGLEIDTWYALYAPKGTPAPIIDRVSKEVARIAEDAEFKARVAKSGATIEYMGPGQLDEYTRVQLAHWTGIIRKLGIKVQ